MNRLHDIVIVYDVAAHMAYLRGVFGEEIKQYHPYVLPVISGFFFSAIVRPWRHALNTLDPRWSFLFLHIRMLPSKNEACTFIYDLENETWASAEVGSSTGYWGNDG